MLCDALAELVHIVAGFRHADHFIAARNKLANAYILSELTVPMNAWFRLIGSEELGDIWVKRRSKRWRDMLRIGPTMSTHTAGALYEAFPAPEAHRILQRLEFHYTPKHASWLNMVEIEIGVLRGQCLDRRIGDRAVLNIEVAAWQRQRNASGARIKWKFTTQKARKKLARGYPDAANESKSL
jgi:hypothetical protein